MSTLVKGDTVPISFIGTAADVLKQYPNSPYTAFLVTTQDQVESYAQHCARLVDGLGILVAADSTNSLATVDDNTLCQHVQSKIRSGVKVAVSACRANQQPQTDPSSIMVTALIDNRYMCAVVLAASDLKSPLHVPVCLQA
ncbi:hypothetical protein ABBQ38_009857 [Trebouxia sp. C0009 RCD-2024]